jgi:hypothetical protein
MLNGRIPRTTAHIGCLMAVALATGAQADITIEERTTVEGAGLMRMANMSGTTVTTISGDRARIESDLQMQSRVVRMFARGMGPTADLVRLDQDKVYQLDVKKKQYSEQSLAEQRAQMQAALEQASKAQPPVGGVDQSQCEWSPPKADVKRSGERATFAGMDAERITITATQSCRDKNSGAVCDFGLALDQWVAPKFGGADEVQKFSAAYAQKMGFDSREGLRRAEALFGKYKDMWNEVAKRTRDVQGHPVRSTFGLVVGGPQCAGANQGAQPASSPGASTPGGIAGRIAGGLFKKRGGEEQAPAAAPALQVNGLTPILTVTSELTSVKQEAAPADLFEVPADFRKVDRQ